MSALIVMSALASAGWCVAWLLWRRETIARKALARREEHYQTLLDAYVERGRPAKGGER
jgi:hypothetical protein